MDPQNILNQFSAGTFSSLTSWAFLSCCLCIAVLILTFKRAVKQFWPAAYAKSTIHGFFTLSYLFAGLIAAIPNGYLAGTAYFNRAILGILASGASLLVYHAAYKRFAKAIGIPDSYVNGLDDDKGEVKEVKVEEKPVDKPV